MSLSTVLLRTSNPLRSSASSNLTHKPSTSTSILQSTSIPTFSRPYATVSSKNVTPTPSPSSNLTWEQYLKLRSKRSTYGFVTTIPTTALAAVTSGSYFLGLEIDPSNMIFGLDPLLIHGLATVACTGLGWLIGPSLGNLFFNLTHKSMSESLSAKDLDFHNRIRHWRPNPQHLPPTMQNRLPDYYGEKIGSISDYRKWLREQSNFKRRARHGVKDDDEMDAQ